MEREGSVTLVHVKNGATPASHKLEASVDDLYYYLPNAGGEREKTEKVLREKAGLKFHDGAFPHSPNPEESAHVVLMFYTHNGGMLSTGTLHSFPVVSGQAGYYYLPGANRDMLIQELEKAGFKHETNLLNAIDSAYKSKVNC